MRNIFRKEALDQMSAASEDDSLVRVVTAPGWMALTGFTILILVTLIWAIFGSITTHITGQGIILKKGGVFSIVSNGTGQVIEVKVNERDYVEKGDVIAVINQPELSEKIRITENQLEKLRNEFRDEKEAAQKRFAVRKNYLGKQKEITTENIKNFESRLKFVNEQLTSQKELLDKGLITNEQYENLKQQKQEVQLNIRQTNNELVQLEYDLLQLESQRDDLLQKSENRIDQIERELQILRSQYEVSSKVISSFEGTILELKVYEGSNVGSGMAVASIESNETELQSVVYLSPFEGKKVKEGMDVQVVPSTVTKEEDGFMLGEVIRVSKFPLSASAIKATIDNEGLIGLFTKSGPPIAVTVHFKRNDQTSNYKWSSDRSKDIEITPGTLCNSEIMVKEQSPISLLLPYLKKII